MSSVPDLNGMIAIVIPCFNAASTLAASIESALMQDVLVEAIVVDDGSTDQSLQIARKFEPKVRVLTGPNRGASYARNIGIEQTTAEWIVFLDSDDLLEPGTLTKRLRTAQESMADVIICDWLEVRDDDLGPITPATHRSLDWEALHMNAEIATAVDVWATTAAILYRRSIVEKIGGFRPDLPVIQDARFLFDAAYHGARFAHSAHIGARYHLLAQSLSHRSPERFWLDVLANGAQIEELWRSTGDLSPQQTAALAAIYNNVARELFRASNEQYFYAVERQHSLNHFVPLHSRIGAPLARTVGLQRARQMLRLLGR